MTFCTTATLSRGRPSSAAGYTVCVTTSYASQLGPWGRMAESGGALAFQSRAWLEAWLATIGRRTGLEPLAVTFSDGNGRPIVGLPLVRETKGLRRIGFADGGVADYNAPILGPDAPQDAAGATTLWRLLLRALPKADLISLERMPARIGALTNPFATLSGARPAGTNGLDLHMAGSFTDWRQALPRLYRKELGRCARLFESQPGARFERALHDSDAAFEALERLQRDRIGALQLTYALDILDARDFYRRLANDLSGGPGVLTTLVVEERVIAVLFGVCHGSRYTMLRIGADAAYSRMSPARHLIVRTIETLRRENIAYFDFGLGDYTYKRKLGGQPIELFDLVAARSPFGLGEAAALHLKAGLRAHPRMHGLAKRIRGSFGR